MADARSTIPKDVWDRMPQDLQEYLAKQESLPNVPICERTTADVETEVINAAPFKMRVYYPSKRKARTVVFLHFPGGICKQGIDRDQSWCSNMAHDSESIYISVDYPSAPQSNLVQMVTDCLYAYELIRQMCDGEWRKMWGTDPGVIVLSGSSVGATFAIALAAIAAQNEQPAYGLIAMVPLVNTRPDEEDDPWGRNKNTVGLTPDRLLNDLKAAFACESPGDIPHWHSNPCEMPDDVLAWLPRTILAIASLDILYKSQIEFINRLSAQKRNLTWREFDGLHQVKDMDDATAAGRAMREYIRNESMALVAEASSM